jgi:hypothetical protein
MVTQYIARTGSRQGPRARWSLTGCNNGYRRERRALSVVFSHTDTRGMTVQWVFSRGHEETRIEVVSTAEICTIRVQRTNGLEHWTSLPTLWEAMLQQAHLERALTISGWHLARFQRFPM